MLVEAKKLEDKHDEEARELTTPRADVCVDEAEDTTYSSSDEKSYDASLSTVIRHSSEPSPKFERSQPNSSANRFNRPLQRSDTNDTVDSSIKNFNKSRYDVSVDEPESRPSTRQEHLRERDHSISNPWTKTKLRRAKQQRPKEDIQSTLQSIALTHLQPGLAIPYPAIHLLPLIPAIISSHQPMTISLNVPQIIIAHFHLRLIGTEVRFLSHVETRLIPCVHQLQCQTIFLRQLPLIQVQAKVRPTSARRRR